MRVEAIGEKDLQKKLKEEKGLMVVDFWAEWCHPCKIVGRVLEDVAEEFGDRVSFFKLNVDQSPELPISYNILSIPTIIFFRDGQEVDRIVGAAPRDVFVERIEELLRK